MSTALRLLPEFIKGPAVRTTRGALEFLAREALEQRDQALAKSRRTLQLAERVIESSFEGIMVTDKDVCIEFVNPAFTQLTGYTA